MLARAALEQLRDAGAATTRIQATVSAAGVPLGAFAGAIDADVRSDDPLELCRRTVEALLAPAGRRPLAIGSTMRTWVWDTSQGNALYVRELVRGALDSGALSRAGELWRMQAPAPISASLFELVATRIGELDGAEREVLELLALGEPLRLDELTELIGLAAVGKGRVRGLAARHRRRRGHRGRRASPP